MTIREKLITDIAACLAVLGKGWDWLLPALKKGGLSNYSTKDLLIVRHALRRKLSGA